MKQIRHNVFETNSSSSHSLVYTSNGCKGKSHPDFDYDVYLTDFEGDDYENGILGVSFGSYEWYGEPCKSFRTKLSYLLTQLSGAGGHGFHWYDEAAENNEDKFHSIKTQEDWDERVKIFEADSNVQKVLNLVKEKCPNIKGFKFYWYPCNRTHDIKNAYEWYKYKRNIQNDDVFPGFNDKFWEDIGYDSPNQRHGFGSVDHQSIGTATECLDSTKDLEKFLFDNNLWVIITNDNC